MAEETIGDRIRERRKALGLTQPQLAAAAHTSAQNISNYERGVYRPDFDAARALARALRIPIERLAGESGTMVVREGGEPYGMPPGLAQWVAQRTMEGRAVRPDHLKTLAQIALRHGRLETWDRAYEAVLLDEQSAMSPPTSEESAAGANARKLGAKALPKRERR